MTEAAVSQQLR